MCQRNKGEKTHPTRLLHPFPITKGKWESISTDFITRFPIVQGKDCIFMVVDILTIFSHLFAIPAWSSASQEPELFFREVFQLHGLLKTIFNDWDNRFMGGFWQYLFRLVGKELTPIISYHV